MSKKLTRNKSDKMQQLKVAKQMNNSDINYIFTRNNTNIDFYQANNQRNLSSQISLMNQRKYQTFKTSMPIRNQIPQITIENTTKSDLQESTRNLFNKNSRHNSLEIP